MELLEIELPGMELARNRTVRNGTATNRTATNITAPKYVELPEMELPEMKLPRTDEPPSNNDNSPTASPTAELDDTDDSVAYAASGRPKQSRVTLMIRGKANKPSLKTVNIDDAELQKRWTEEKEKAEKEREDMKRLTLGQQRRIEMEEEKALMASLMGAKKGGKRGPNRAPPKSQFPKATHLDGEW
uniref:Upf2 domain-containing protein n=1 Tax=Caenorhabditis japonica TaxID=281687 RepID=A0A8R1HHN2_CAEJA